MVNVSFVVVWFLFLFNAFIVKDTHPPICYVFPASHTRKYLTLGICLIGLCQKEC